MNNRDTGLNAVFIGNDQFGITGWGCLLGVGVIILAAVTAGSARRQDEGPQARSSAPSVANVEHRIPQGEFAVAVNRSTGAVSYHKSGTHRLTKDHEVSRFRSGDTLRTILVQGTTPALERQFGVPFHGQSSKTVTLTISYKLSSAEAAATQPFKLGKKTGIDECVKEIVRDWLAIEHKTVQNVAPMDRQPTTRRLAEYLTRIAKLEEVQIVVDFQ